MTGFSDREFNLEERFGKEQFAALIRNQEIRGPVAGSHISRRAASNLNAAIPFIGSSTARFSAREEAATPSVKPEHKPAYRALFPAG